MCRNTQITGVADYADRVKKTNMAGTDTINQIVSEKLDDNNFHAWKFRITNFLMGKGYWEYIEGEHEEAPVIPEENPTPAQVKAFKEWN